MLILDVECPDYQVCGETQSIDIEHESSGEGTIHEVTCKGCQKKYQVTINYVAVACDEKFIQE